MLAVVVLPLALQFAADRGTQAKLQKRVGRYAGEDIHAEYLRAVVTGDVTQVDLPNRQESGLKNAIRILKDVKDIGFTYFSPKDVVRHPLVQRIVEAYESDDNGGRDS